MKFFKRKKQTREEMLEELKRLEQNHWKTILLEKIALAISIIALMAVVFKSFFYEKM